MDTADRYWVMAGDVPAGPFTAAEVHDRLAAGQLTWDAKACPVGGGEWRPLARTPGFGPAAGESATAATPPPERPPVAAPASGSRPAKPHANDENPWVMRAVLVGFLVYVAWIVYDTVRPVGPVEVCERLAAATTVVDARKYVTPRLYPVAAELMALPDDSHPADRLTFSGGDDFGVPDARMVDVTGTAYDAAAGRQMTFSGTWFLVRADGWKVDEMTVSAVDGTTLPAPVSIQEVLRQTAAAGSGGAASKPAAGREWYAPLKPWLKVVVGGAALAAMGGAYARRRG